MVPAEGIEPDLRFTKPLLYRWAKPAVERLEGVRSRAESPPLGDDPALGDLPSSVLSVNWATMVRKAVKCCQYVWNFIALNLKVCIVERD